MPRPAHISRKTAAFGLERLGALGGHARAQRGGAWGMELFAQPGASRLSKTGDRQAADTQARSPAGSNRQGVKFLRPAWSPALQGDILRRLQDILQSRSAPVLGRSNVGMCERLGNVLAG